MELKEYKQTRNSLDDTLKVNEIFVSIEGEGLNSGLPTIFVRLFGCNLSCSYCDTQYACVGNEYRKYSIDDIAKYCELIRKFKSVSTITLTGGEPLLDPNAITLIKKLDELGFLINIETNGSIGLETIKDLRKDKILKSTQIMMDWKMPSSGQYDKMKISNLELLTEKDAIKFVVSTQQDLKELKALIINKYRFLKNKPHIYVSAVFNKITHAEIVEYILANELTECRVQLQIHKYIWPADKKGV